MRLHLGEGHDQVRAPGRIREIDLGQIGESGQCGYVIAVEVDEQGIEIFDSPPVVRLLRQAHGVAPMSGPLADKDFGGAQTAEQLDGGRDHRHVRVDRGVGGELDQVRLEQHALSLGVETAQFRATPHRAEKIDRIGGSLEDRHGGPARRSRG